MRYLALIVAMVFIGAVFNNTQAQKKDDTILKIGEYDFSAGEFWHVYNKNKHLPGFNESAEDFSERFINYKLKVVEAITQGMDTLPAFKNEFSKYAEDLKASFLIDSLALEATAKQAYNHMQQVVKASHILIRLQPNSSPQDTLTAYEKIASIRKKALNGDDFGSLASTYSEDPSAASNQGYLGYFSAFRMIYPFEKAAFETPIGQVSEIVRTDFGYHLIYVQDRIENPGKIQVAHIMMMFPRDASDAIIEEKKIEINKVYSKIVAGDDFAQLASAYSEDTNSASQGGEMRAFSLQEMVPEFAFAAFALENNGDVSEPVKTDFGWHIIKRIEHEPIGSYASQRSYIMNMMGRDGRDKAGQEAFILNKRKSSDFKLNTLAYDAISKLLENTVTDNDEFFNSVQDSEAVLFGYANENVSVNDFINSLKESQSFSAREGVVGFNRVLDEKIASTILTVEKRDLAKRNADYRYLVNEYHDGLLIFDISNNEIWQKVGQDSLALENHYNNNMAKFAGPPTLDGVICEVHTKRLLKRASKLITAQGTENLVQILKDNARSEKCYTCHHGSFSFVIGGNPVLADMLPEGNALRNSKATLYWNGQIATPSPKPFAEIRGQVMSSYQTELESIWVKSLKEKHNPVFNKDMLKKSK